ncbi:MAG: hypothetical protein ACREB2_05975 [Pseudolabrys sp.]
MAARERLWHVVGTTSGALKGKYAGQMDMAKASGMVKAKLSG